MKKEYLLFLGLLSLITPGLSMKTIFSTVTLAYLMAPICMYFWMLNPKKILFDKTILITFAMFYLLTLIGLLRSDYIEQSMIFFLGFILFIFCIFSFVFYANSIENVEYESLIYYLSIFVIITSVIMYMLGLFYYNPTMEHSTYFGVFVEKGIPRNIGLANDPNLAAAIFGFFFCFLLLTDKKNSNKYALLSFILVLSTLSRSGSLIILITYILIFSFELKKFKIISLLIVTSVLLFFVLTFVDIPNILIDIFDKRINGSMTGGGRFEIWRNAFEMFNLNPIFGSGTFSFRMMNLKYFNDSHYAHNTFIDIIVELGITGLFLYLLFFTSLIIRSYYLPNKFRFVFYANIYIFMMSFTLSVYINGIFAFYLVNNAIVISLSKRSNV